MVGVAFICCTFVAKIKCHLYARSKINEGLSICKVKF